MADTTIVARARLYDGNGGAGVDDAVLIVEDDRIVYAGPSGRAPSTQGEVIDAEGRFLVPGLIDSHVHLSFDASADFEGFASRATPEQVLDLCAENAATALRAGITSVRDLGGIGEATIATARSQRAGALRAARILTAGEVVTIPGGHVHFIGRLVSSPDEMRKTVAELHEAGADLIKIVATGGVLTQGVSAQDSAFSQAELDACVEEAHARGMRVAAHAIGASGIEGAARAGVDSIEHGCFLTDGAVETMISNPSWLVPTLSAPDRISHGGDGVPEYARMKSAEIQVSHRASFSRAVRDGVRIATGTDAGTPYNRIGGLHYEMALMHAAGMPLDRLLQSATREAAQLLGFGELGVLERGRIADFVLLDADPLVDVSAYQRVALVAQDGQIMVDER